MKLLRGLVLVICTPLALALGLMPKRLFEPRALAELDGIEEDDGETWIAEGTARVELL